MQIGLAALMIAASTQAFAQSSGGGGGGGGGNGGESSVTAASVQILPGYIAKERRSWPVDVSKFKLVPIRHIIDNDPPSMPPSLTPVLGPTNTPSINVPAARTSVQFQSQNCTVRDITLRYC